VFLPLAPLLALFTLSCGSSQSRGTQPVYFTYTVAPVAASMPAPSASETTPSEDHATPVTEPQPPKPIMTKDRTKQTICQEVSVMSKMCSDARDNGNRKEDALYGYTQLGKSIREKNGLSWSSVDAMAMRLGCENAYSHPELTPDEVEKTALKTCLSARAK
jgi:hypothetical protein